MRKLTPLWLLVLALPAFSQTIDGSITGRTVDSSGAAIQNASITVQESSKDLKVVTKSTTEGNFTVSGLQPGKYTVTVEAAGFKKAVRSGVNLDANEKLAMGAITMEVGAVTEAVEVTAAATMLQTESVERSATITGTQVENIEVNGRNALDMAKLIPGVQFTTGTSYAIGSSSNGANDFTVRR